MAERLAWQKLMRDRRMLVLLGLGFASGLPLMLTGRTLKVWARDAGVDLETVGLFSLVTLPYSLKFLWAPVMDWRSPMERRLGRRRGWLLICQACLMVGIAWMGWCGPRDGDTPLMMFAIAALAVAFFSASQDVVEAAYRTDILKPEEVGAGASVSVTGYRTAMLATGAGAVALAGMLQRNGFANAWTIVYSIAAGLMVVGVAATWLAPPLPRIESPVTLAQAVVEPAREFVGRNGPRAATILLFIVLFKLPDYMAESMTDSLLLDVGFSKEQIAVWSLGMGTAVTIPGVLLGGWIVSSLGLRTGLLVFGIAQAVSNAGYLLLWSAGRSDVTMVSVVAVEYFCKGLVAAGFVAFLMRQCDKRYSATQFALLTALMALSASLGGAPAGYIVKATGYSWFLVITMLAAIPGLAMLPWIEKRGIRG